MFEKMTKEVILDRMLSRISDNLDKREGSVIWDALAPAALELESAYFALDTILNETFADTASREYLIRRAKERGLTPERATNAVLKAIFNIDIPLGSRFSLNDLNYTVISKIGDSGQYKEYQVKCETVGRVGGMYFGNIIPIDYIEGLTTAKITELLIPGEDEEDTEVFRQRYFDSFNVQAYGGNIADYKKKVHEIEGVGAVKVTPVWNGGGTVKLTIIDSDYNLASSSLIEKVQELIDPTKDGRGLGIAPIGHIVTVDTGTNVAVNITTSITFEKNYNWELLKDEIEKDLKEYVEQLRLEWAPKYKPVSNNIVVRTARIEARILAIKGVLDISDTKINNSRNNLYLTDFQLPLWGGITV